MLSTSVSFNFLLYYHVFLLWFAYHVFLLLIRRITVRKKLKGKSKGKKKFLPLNLCSSHFFKAQQRAWGLNRTLNSRSILDIVYTMDLGFRKVLLKILDPGIGGFSRNVCHGNSNTSYFPKVDCSKIICTTLSTIERRTKKMLIWKTWTLLK